MTQTKVYMQKSLKEWMNASIGSNLLRSMNVAGCPAMMMNNHRNSLVVRCGQITRRTPTNIMLHIYSQILITYGCRVINIHLVSSCDFLFGAKSKIKHKLPPIYREIATNFATTRFTKHAPEYLDVVVYLFSITNAWLQRMQRANCG